MKLKIIFLILLMNSSAAFSQKTVYIPKSIKSMDLSNTSSQWCNARSKQSDNIVVFWEAGFGNDPSTASGSYKVDINKLLGVAEMAYTFYLDTLKFAIKGSSVTDKYKLIIFLLYSTEWAAYGSGQDDMVGTLQVNPAAANYPNVVAHETGHCFEYITGCDTDGGYQYGFGENAGGGNGFWEQCAQWMSFKVYPDQQFKDGDFLDYIKNNHLHIIHETPRYANYFLMDYWTYKHDLTFMGKLWRESIKPEDPVETYKRLNSLTQAQFNDEIYEHAARLTTWDLPAIRSYGEKYIDSRAQVKMNLTSDNYWLIDTSVCIQNYGYNCIKLNAPSRATEVSAVFKGKAGASGFRGIKTDKGGWRFGFVALLSDGTRKYGEMTTANMSGSTNPEKTLTFGCPDNCSKLWLVASGAPQEHWRHPWDDDISNDEQWPYQVQFRNTNLLGQKTEIVLNSIKKQSTGMKPCFAANQICFPFDVHWQITGLSGKLLISGFGMAADIKCLSNGSYLVNCNKQCFRFVKK
jgi:hypothetical protein